MSPYLDMNPPATNDDLVWRALSEPFRRRMLDVLATAPQTTGDIVEQVPELCRTAVMKHLDVLEEAGLVIVRRDGRTRWNHFNPVPIDRICRTWMDRHRRRMSSALNRLKDVVEADLPASTHRPKPRVTAKKSKTKTQRKKSTAKKG